MPLGSKHYTIRALAAEGICVIIKCVLTPFNIADLEDFIDFVVTLGVSEVGVSYMEPGAIGSGANRLPNVTTEQIETVRSVVAQKRDEYEGVCGIHPPRKAACRWDETGWYPCGGLFTGMSVFPSGDVAICDKLGDVSAFVYGNVFQHTLKEIWNGDAFRALRARTLDLAFIDANCARCTKLNACRTGCFVDSFRTSGNYYGKHPNCSGPF